MQLRLTTSQRQEVGRRQQVKITLVDEGVTGALPARGRRVLTFEVLGTFEVLRAMTSRRSQFDVVDFFETSREIPPKREVTVPVSARSTFLSSRPRFIRCLQVPRRGATTTTFPTIRKTVSSLLRRSFRRATPWGGRDMLTPKIN